MATIRMKLAVVIPTYKYHIPVLKYTLDSVAEQTCIPDHVIVRASSCDAECSSILAELRLFPWPFPLTILETETVQNAGQNRNAGVAAVPDDIDIISFFDSDDLMHPRRLEFVKRYIAEGYDVVCHGFTGLPWNMTEEPVPVVESYIKYETVRAAFTGELVKVGRVIFLDENDDEVGFTDGPLTLRKECFNGYASDQRGHQECIFFSGLHRTGYKVINLNMGLMIYTPTLATELLEKHLP
jgi:glycosyltransferase involved in cell wall biosynthesis